MGSMISIHGELTLKQKFLHINVGLLLLIVAVACVGFAALYSAANGSYSPWAIRQMVRFLVGLIGMIIIAVIDIRWWQRLAYPAYAAGIFMLIAVKIMGVMGGGAQRWVDLGVIQLQPSEIMKIAVVMALARYFHARDPEDMKRLFVLIPPALMVLLPVGLVMLQPDLGTALMIGMVGAALFFLGGTPLWIFIAGIAAVVVSVPVAWKFFIHDYQKQRVLTFINPESDPLGSGYHITQSKIALGSGGLEGKGFMKGTQSHLNFLPEKQTDFIFTLWAEEWGMLGGLALLALFAMIFLYCAWIALRCRHVFGRLMAFGLMINFSLYIFINVAMVMGLIPVVGVPLPLVSYGGTAMLAVLIGFGLIMSCSIHRDSKLPRV